MQKSPLRTSTRMCLPSSGCHTRRSHLAAVTVSNLHDSRSGGTHHIFTHPYPISKLKWADGETRLVCSGLQDTLFLYDIRTPRPSKSSSRNIFNYDNHHYNEAFFKARFSGNRDSKKRRKLNHKAFRDWSQPVSTFPHANSDLLGLDIDVHPGLGLLAADQDASSDIGIRISNRWTGRIVKEIKHRTDSILLRKAHRILKFTNRNKKDEGVNMWSCGNGGIAKFS
jgi:hypothetical protein